MPNIYSKSQNAKNQLNNAEVDRNATWPKRGGGYSFYPRQTEILLVTKCPRGLMVYQQYHIKVFNFHHILC